MWRSARFKDSKTTTIVIISALDWAYLFIFELEDQVHLVAIDGFLDNLGCHPALGDIWLPSSRADIVGMRHGRLLRSRIEYRIESRFGRVAEDGRILGHFLSGKGESKRHSC